MAKAAKHEEAKNAMDYSEHDKTYAGFIWLTKWTTIALLIIMIALAFSTIGGGGLAGFFLVSIALGVLAWFVL